MEDADFSFLKVDLRDKKKYLRRDSTELNLNFINPVK